MNRKERRALRSGKAIHSAHTAAIDVAETATGRHVAIVLRSEGGGHGSRSRRRWLRATSADVLDAPALANDGGTDGRG